ARQVDGARRRPLDPSQDDRVEVGGFGGYRAEPQNRWLSNLIQGRSPRRDLDEPGRRRRYGGTAREPPREPRLHGGRQLSSGFDPQGSIEEEVVAVERNHAITSR